VESPAHLFSWTPWIDGASICAVAVVVAKAFEWFDGLISDESRVTLWLYLADVPSDERIDSWATVFPKLIDKIYGPKVLSVRFLFRSTISSLLAVAITALLALRFGPSKYELGSYLESALIGGMIANLVPDYFSLILSRAIVKIMSFNPNFKRIGLLLIADTVFTAILGATSYYIYVHSVIGVARYFDHLSFVYEVQSRMRELRNGLASSGTGNGFRIVDVYQFIFFCSAFFTSVWVWLYVTSVFVIKIAHKARTFWLKMMPYLDIEQKPMQAIGRIAGVIAGSGYAVMLALAWMSKHCH
jgi:hypothetical protein